MKLTQAQIAHINKLQDRQGRLTPRRVVEDARKPSSPLHNLSVWRGWNGKRLIDIQLLHCARLIIGAVTVQVTHNHSVLKSQVYVVDTSVKGQGYRNIAAMRTDPESARESLVFTLETAAGHLRRAYDLAIPLGMAKEIDALLAQITGVARIVQKKAA